MSLAEQLERARERALSPDDAVSERGEVEGACLQVLEQLLLYPEHAYTALWLALQLTRSSLGPAEAERRLLAWAAEREAEGGAERPYTAAENRLLTVARALRGEP